MQNPKANVQRSTPNAQRPTLASAPVHDLAPDHDHDRLFFSGAFDVHPADGQSPAPGDAHHGVNPFLSLRERIKVRAATSTARNSSVAAVYDRRSLSLRSSFFRAAVLICIRRAAGFVG
jgi:hypothetical protein